MKHPGENQSKNEQPTKQSSRLNKEPQYYLKYSLRNLCEPEI